MADQELHPAAVWNIVMCRHCRGDVFRVIQDASNTHQHLICAGCKHDYCHADVVLRSPAEH